MRVADSGPAGILAQEKLTKRIAEVSAIAGDDLGDNDRLFQSA